MCLRSAAVCVLAAAIIFSCGCRNDRASAFTLNQITGTVQLPPGVLEIRDELAVPAGAHDLEIVGAPEGTVLRASDDFRGRAVLSLRSARRIRLTGFTIDGNRPFLEERTELATSDMPLAEFYCHNGLLAERVDTLNVSAVRFQNVADFAVIVSESRGVVLERIRVADSGSHNSRGRNNSSGGVLFEEGTSEFQVSDSLFTNILGNGVWTHSLYTSPRNRNGVIRGNTFRNIGRDAIQVGHATNVRVEDNKGDFIGYPVGIVDVENVGIPVAIDTAGNVDRSVYAGNRFNEINGKCIDLDGFHNGEVRGNVCTNQGKAEDYPTGHYGIVMNNSNPDIMSENIRISENVIDGTKFGGIFMIGSGHTVVNNKLRNLNTAGCNESVAKFACLNFAGEPDILQSGIYLGRGADRPDVARKNTVEGNEISGHRMASRCIGFAPGVRASANRIVNNRCSDAAGEKR